MKKLYILKFVDAKTEKHAFNRYFTSKKSAIKYVYFLANLFEYEIKIDYVDKYRTYFKATCVEHTDYVPFVIETEHFYK